MLLDPANLALAHRLAHGGGHAVVKPWARLDEKVFAVDRA